jgi:hypothetical protein
VPAFQKSEPLALSAGRVFSWLRNACLKTSLTFGVPRIIPMLAGAAYFLCRSFVFFCAWLEPGWTSRWCKWQTSFLSFEVS